MSLIVSEVYDALIEAGSSPEKARAAAAAVPAAENMATREDIARLESRMATKEDIGDVRQDISEIRQDISEIRQDIVKLESRMATKEDLGGVKQDIAKLELATKKDIARLEKKIAALNVAVFSLGPAILAMLVKLTFFP